MRTHIIFHRLVTRDAPAQTRISSRKEFDVAAARKMLREGATLEAIGAAQGLGGQCVRNRLRALGLGYLISDPVRVGEARSRGQRQRLEREKAAQ